LKTYLYPSSLNEIAKLNQIRFIDSKGAPGSRELNDFDPAFSASAVGRKPASLPEFLQRIALIMVF
jgi:hypothetical protein